MIFILKKLVPIAICICILSGCVTLKYPSDYFADLNELRSVNVPHYFSSFDIREMPGQVQGYFEYVQRNNTFIELQYEKLRESNVAYLKPGGYICGENIQPGRYFMAPKNYRDGALGLVISNDGKQSYTLFTDTVGIFELHSGDSFTVHAEQNVAPYRFLPIEETVPPVYFEGAYAVSENLSSGIYFVLVTSTNGFGTVRNDKDKWTEFKRFGYYEIKEDDKFINLKGCILIEMDSRPKINPIITNNRTEYPQGMYKIGIDIPEGEYYIQSDIFFGVMNIDDSTVHANISQSNQDAVWTWRGCQYYDQDLQVTRKVELNSYDKGPTRVIRSGISDAEYQYEEFIGDPVVIISNEYSYVSIDKARLISIA